MTEILWGIALVLNFAAGYVHGIVLGMWLGFLISTWSRA